MNWFARKLKNKGLSLGIVVARSGISGDESREKDAYAEISDVLRDGCRIIVITLQDLEGITDTDQIVKMLKWKLLKLVISSKK
ncbi:MAG: hypothetical protein HY223_06855 [Thaumarchaeota archaeon]|nr:hypothetical protein [Nitrososphaerota archaeon]